MPTIRKRAPQHHPADQDAAARAEARGAPPQRAPRIGPDGRCPRCHGYVYTNNVGPWRTLGCLACGWTS